MFDSWMILQVAAFGGLMFFGSYLSYRMRVKRQKRIRKPNAVLV
jgi:hypothetical protein